MVDVQTNSEKLRDRARRIVHIVTGLDAEEADKLLKSAHWNVKAAIVMQKTGLTYTQGAGAPAQGRGSVPRRDRRGHRAAPARSSSASSRRCVEHHRQRRGCSCRNDAGSSRRDRSVHQPRCTAAAFVAPGRDQHDRARAGGSSPSPSTAPRAARAPCRRRTERVGRPRRGSQPRRVGPRRQGIGRLVEADVAVAADAEHHAGRCRRRRRSRARSARTPRRDPARGRRGTRCDRDAG